MTNRSEVHHDPIEVLVEDGTVGLSGPECVMVLSPEAAEKTSDRLWKGAMFARQQQRKFASSD